MKTKFRLLETVVLTRDLPGYSLLAGDLGAIVEVHHPNGYEVEFVTASGCGGAVVTLVEGDLRAVEDTDLIRVRPLDQTAPLNQKA